ncbi:MAG: hypothetical protein ACK5YL_02020 [Holosporales bacterium]|jgi:hypothetical protein
MAWQVVVAAVIPIIIEKLFGGGGSKSSSFGTTESNSLAPSAFQNLTGAPTTTDPSTTSRLNILSSTTPPTVPSSSPFSTFTLGSSSPRFDTTSPTTFKEPPPVVRPNTSSSTLPITTPSGNPFLRNSIDPTPRVQQNTTDAQVYNVNGSEYKWGRQDKTIILLTRKYGEEGQGQKISYTTNDDGSISINGTSVVLQPNQIRKETDLATKVGGYYTDNRDRPDWNTNLFDDSKMDPTMIASAANLNSAMNGSFATGSALTASGAPVADNSGLLAAAT